MQPSPEDLAQMIEKIKASVEGLFDPLVFTDHICFLFLRSNKWDLEKTINVVKEYMAWRKSDNVDKVLVDPLPKNELMQSMYPHRWHGVSKEDRPLYIDRIGVADPAALFEKFTMDELKIHHMFILEEGRRLAAEEFKASGRRVDETVQIFDMKGFGKRHFNSQMLEYLKWGLPMEQKFYPGLLKKLFIINAPLLFRALFKMISPLIDPETREKVAVLGKDYYSQLLTEINEDNIPTFLGGKCNNCGGNCLSHGDYIAPAEDADESGQLTDLDGVDADAAAAASS